MKMNNEPKKLNKRDKAAIEAAARQVLLQDILALELRAHSLNMHVTAHSLNRAKNALGWEIAGDVAQAGKASRDDRS